MDTFTISQLAQFSGIKPHTIRMWEQRYNALQPQRTEGNTRYYDNSQLRRLLNIVSLLNFDFKVSDLCSMSDTRLFKILKEQYENNGAAHPENYYIAQLISAALSFNENQFHKIFGHCILRFQVKGTYEKILYPVLERIGLLWANNEIHPATEHFIINLVRQKLYTAIDALPPVSTPSSKWVCYLPEDEFHDIGLLYAWYTIKNANKNVYYLGANMPHSALVAAANEINPEYIFSFLVRNNLADNTSQYIKQLSLDFNRKTICIAAAEHILQGVKLPKNVIWLKTSKELEQYLM